MVSCVSDISLAVDVTVVDTFVLPTHFAMNTFSLVATAQCNSNMSDFSVGMCPFCS